MNNAIEQAKFADMTDEQLRDAVGALHEYCKKLAEAKAEDEEIKELEAELKELKEERYGEDLKAAGRKLKAARQLARARGIVFTVPTTGEGNE